MKDMAHSEEKQRLGASIQATTMGHNLVTSDE